MKDILKLKYSRAISQIVFFILYPGLFALSFSQIGRTYSMLISSSSNVYTLGMSIVSALVLLILTAVLGRFFCGWMCSFGSLCDILYYINTKLFKNKLKIKIGYKTDFWLKKLKYIILLFIFVVFWTFKFKPSTNMDPWTTFANLIALPPQLPTLSIGLALLIIIVIGDFLIERFFCRYLCPLGAIFAVTSKLKFINIRKPKSECGKCTLCSKKCSMNLKLYEVDRVTDGNCINCFKCVSVCPKNNARVSVVKRAVNTITVVAISILAFFGLQKVQTKATNVLSKKIVAQTSNQGSLNAEISAMNSQSSNSNNDSNSNSNNNQTASNTTNSASSNSSTSSDSYYVPTKGFNAGTYTGTARGYKSNITVSVTVSSNQIENVDITSIHDTPEYEATPVATIPSEILSKQSPYVDVVSGATYSSNGIINAVKKALAKAQS